MKVALITLLSSSALFIGSFVVAAADQGPRPGEMSPPNVWVQNRRADEAIPVNLVRTGQPLRVQIADPRTGLADNVVTTRAARQVWEYTQVRVKPTEDIAAALNEAGANGWEATGVQLATGDATVVVLKRPR